MPRAVTRAISTSFAGPHSYSGVSSRDVSSGKASHGLDLYPSPRPMKAARSSSKPVTASVSSPSTQTATVSTSGPVTPPTKQQPEKRKRGKEDGMPQRQIDTFLANYDLEAANRIRMANQALQVSIESARAQMIASISAFPRHILSMRLEEYLNPVLPPAPAPEQQGKGKRGGSIHPGPVRPDKVPRAARPGEIVYSMSGSPIALSALGSVGLASSDEEDEPSFDTASDKSSTSESFSLPDEVAYTAQVMEQERNRIISSDGFLPRSSSMFHRSSST